MISGVRFARTLSLATLLSFASLHAQSENPVNTRVLVRADVKGGSAPVLSTNDVHMNVAGRDLPVTRVTPVVAAAGLSGRSRAQPLEVAVLLDDGLRGQFNTNLGELSEFLRNTVSPTTAVGLGYMRNGAAFFPKGFSNDPDVVEKAVRLPLGSAGISASPYFCVQDLVKHWPTQTGAARVVLMITNGIDYYNGSVSPLNQNSPYVDAAIRDAQRARIPVYSIYFGNRAVNGFYSSASGQSYLAKVAEETGGVTYNQGQLTPPSIQPFLRQFHDALSSTYAVEFQDNSRDLQRLKVSSSVSGVRLRAQRQVRAGQALSE